ncbi:hypothetical protein Glove_117g385 [Diversispora epigaea]|uniref:Uncharacterized protein n=1 Tax=Diversispora epigaea TaxID=1348612 RepID=A0A397J6H4_9GLOM|nr:hypothetical protein Glove_117g385 [Diversispora epigaea]
MTHRNSNDCVTIIYIIVSTAAIWTAVVIVILNYLKHQRNVHRGTTTFSLFFILKLIPKREKNDEVDNDDETFPKNNRISDHSLIDNYISQLIQSSSSQKQQSSIKILLTLDGLEELIHELDFGIKLSKDDGLKFII